MAITETKLNESSDNLLYEIEHYYPYQKIREDKGGGVALLVRENVVNEKISIPDTLLNEELVGAALKKDGKYYNFF